MKPRIYTISSYCFPYYKDCRIILKKDIQVKDDKSLWIGLFSGLVEQSYNKR